MRSQNGSIIGAAEMFEELQSSATSRVLMVSFLKETAPIMAVEVARRAVPWHVKPSFKELEPACRGGGAAAAAAAF